MNLIELSVSEAARQIRDGLITSEELLQACLDRTDQVDGDIKAWAHLDRESALEQARMRDEMRMRGTATGPLHGVPIAIKDIIDTAHMSTEHGSNIYSGRVPFDDAIVVQRLREAGAIIIGKTVTAELAVLHPGKTTNPHNVEHTPGGSSSGSAAAVASYMVPGSLGTQTNGSIIRPASFCGVYGFKPSFGLIPRTGVLSGSEPLDTIGTFARSIEDIALITEALIGPDSSDPATSPLGMKLPLSRVCAEEPLTQPRLAFVKSPVWDQADTATHDAFGELCDAINEIKRESLGDNDQTVDPIDLPDVFASVHGWLAQVMNADLARNLVKEYNAGEDKMSAILRGKIEEGRKVTAVDYNNALGTRPRLMATLNEIFDEYDAIITPSATGEAPRGLETTGNPTFCTIWTFCGLPCISLPLLDGENGLPMGVQLVGRFGDDARLLRTANWLMKNL
jgi:Asp-tRNA(Asn)/Glu-tRNA(Gln) amidotransferase A subunit family amidase